MNTQHQLNPFFSSIPRGQIRQYVIRLAHAFYQFNDPAHTPDHFDDVLRHYEEVIRPYIENHIHEERFALFQERYELLDLLVIPIMAHDALAAYRKNHEQLAYDLVLVLCDIFDEHQHAELLALAAKEHRASGDGTMSSVLSMVVAAADKAEPNLNEGVLRAYKCALHNLKEGEPKYLAVIRTKQHMFEKYGSKGYAKYSPLWEELYAPALIAFTEQVDNLTEEDVAEIVLTATEDKKYVPPVQTDTELSYKRRTWEGFGEPNVQVVSGLSVDEFAIQQRMRLTTIMRGLV
jgi:hypothetical protein